LLFEYKIQKEVYQDMIDYCRKHLPYEACGLLSGKEGMGMTLWKVKNESQNLNRFYMSKESIKHAVGKMEELGEQLTGIFHSHPSTPAFPSYLDIKNNPYPELAYMIISFYKQKIKVGCFGMDSIRATPLTLFIVDK
jgi:proteasome lid subunit RPN8/RPN11